MVPYITAFLAVICYGAVGPIIKKTCATLPTFLFIGICSLMLAIGSFLALLATEGRAGFFVPDKSKFLGFFAFAAINLVGWALYMYSIKLIPVAQYDMIAGLGILVTAFFASALLNEPIHLRYIPAFIFIMIGLYIALAPEFRR
jgi:drug/metabolite transporter (DMT)-like permease